MTEEKKHCLITRLRAVMENMLACGYHLQSEKYITALVHSLERGSNLSETQIERAILIMEREQLERHRDMLASAQKKTDKGH